MKIGARILSVLLVLSLISLGFNYYNYDKYKKQVDEKNNLKVSLTNDENKMDTDIINTEIEIEELKKEKPDKVKLLETWKRKNQEVTDLLS